MRRLVPLVVLVAACAGETAASTASGVEPPNTTTSTMAIETTTSEAKGTVDICPRGVVWKIGVIYSAGCFAVPASFEVEVDGWRSRGGQGDWVFVSWVDPDDESRVNVALTALRSNRAISDRMEAILGVTGIEAVGGVEDGVVSGFDAAVADVEGRREASGGALNRRECALEGESVFFGGLAEAYRLADGPRDQFFGVGKCHLARVWVFAAGAHTITIIGGTDSPDRHPEAVAKIEELFKGMTFDTGGGS